MLSAPSFFTAFFLLVSPRSQTFPSLLQQRPITFPPPRILIFSLLLSLSLFSNSSLYLSIVIFLSLSHSLFLPPYFALSLFYSRNLAPIFSLLLSLLPPRLCESSSIAFHLSLSFIHLVVPILSTPLFSFSLVNSALVNSARDLTFSLRTSPHALSLFLSFPNCLLYFCISASPHVSPKSSLHLVSLFPRTPSHI